MTRTLVPRIILLFSAAALVLIGISFKWFGTSWLANSFGGTLYVWFFITLFAAIWPHRRAVSRITLTVFLVTCTIEVMQLWHPPMLQSLRATVLGRYLLGNTFSWSDFIYYVFGSILGWLYASAICYRHTFRTE